MHVSITESGNYQTIGKATVKPLFSGIFCKKYFKFVIIFKREFFHITKPRNLSGITYRFKNHCRYYSKFRLLCQWVGRGGFCIFLPHYGVRDAVSLIKVVSQRLRFHSYR